MPLEQAPKRGRGRPKKQPPVHDLLLDSRDEEMMQKMEENIEILPGSHGRFGNLKHEEGDTSFES